MRGNELLDRMDLIDPEYVEAAELFLPENIFPWAGSQQLPASVS